MSVRHHLKKSAVLGSVLAAVSTTALSTSPDKFHWPDMTGGDLGSRARLRPGSHLWWYPAEVNTTILGGNQWFWARNKQPRTVTQLVEIFYTSVGRNGNLLLNLSPDKRGLVPNNQLDALARTAEIINETFGTDFARGGKVSAEHANATNGPALALDGNLDTWWEAEPGRTNGSVTLTLPVGAQAFVCAARADAALEHCVERSDRLLQVC